jgi:hypothetical protein
MKIFFHQQDKTLSICEFKTIRTLMQIQDQLTKQCYLCDKENQDKPNGD